MLTRGNLGGISIIGALVAAAVFIGLKNAQEPFRAREEISAVQYTDQIAGRIEKITGNTIALNVSVGRSDKLPSITFGVTDETEVQILGIRPRRGTVADLAVGDEARVTVKHSGSEQDAILIEVYKAE